jgi:hypothetical protein
MRKLDIGKVARCPFNSGRIFQWFRAEGGFGKKGGLGYWIWKKKIWEGNVVVLELSLVKKWNIGMERG